MTSDPIILLAYPDRDTPHWLTLENLRVLAAFPGCVTVVSSDTRLDYVTAHVDRADLLRAEAAAAKLRVAIAEVNG